jgi:menaquinone-dependent protoporphyrinogen oxidase
VYFGSWERAAVEFAETNAQALRRLPVWLFSSGPLDWEDARAPVDPPRQVDALLLATGARGHRTFGGVLDAGTAGIVGKAMAEEGMAGDFRDLPAVRAWATEIVATLLPAEPATVPNS